MADYSNDKPGPSSIKRPKRHVVKDSKRLTDEELETFLYESEVEDEFSNSSDENYVTGK